MTTFAMTEDLSDDESYGASINNSIRENNEMLEATIMEQFVEDKISVDDKVQEIEDDDSMKFSSRSLGLGSSSSSPLFRHYLFQMMKIKSYNKILKNVYRQGTDLFQRSINIGKGRFSSINYIRKYLIIITYIYIMFF